MKFPIIEAERIKHNMSREELAQQLGVSRRTIQNWQNGTTEIPLQKLVHLMKLYNCSADYLLGLTSGNLLAKQERRV